MRADHVERIEAVYATELARTDTDDVLAVVHRDDVRVRLPIALPDTVRAAVDAHRADPSAILSPDWWRGVLGRSVDVRGPTVHAFTDAPPPVPLSPVVEQVAPWRLERLRQSVSAREWAASGFGDDADVVFGRFAEPLDPPTWMARATPAARRTTVAAAASLSATAGAFADVGVLTEPAYRGRGLGTEVTAAALDLAVRSTGLARWRADESDRAALAVARRLGFETWSRVLRIPIG